MKRPLQSIDHVIQAGFTSQTVTVGSCLCNLAVAQVKPTQAPARLETAPESSPKVGCSPFPRPRSYSLSKKKAQLSASQRRSLLQGQSGLSLKAAPTPLRTKVILDQTGNYRKVFNNTLWGCSLKDEDLGLNLHGWILCLNKKWKKRLQPSVPLTRQVI